MGVNVTTFTDEFTSPVPAARLFKALILDAHNLYPKITPLGIKSIDTIEGDGDGHATYVKHKVDALDEDKMVYAYTLIEGGELATDKIESISYNMTFESSPSGGCIGNNTSKFHTKEGFEIKEEDIKEGKEKAFGVFKAIEAFLLETPNAYV
ncbi:putative Bet v I/Major latex protein [Helianthus debilis subsp. tardiflorus]